MIYFIFHVPSIHDTNINYMYKSILLMYAFVTKK